MACSCLFRNLSKLRAELVQLSSSRPFPNDCYTAMGKFTPLYLSNATHKSPNDLAYAAARSFTSISRPRPCRNSGKSTRILYRMMQRNPHERTQRERHKSVAMYAVSLALLVGGCSYAAVPLYRLYCQASGYGGTVRTVEVGDKIEKMQKQKQRVIKVKFNADKGATMRWDFRPQQSEIKIVPGETALAFYTARNPTNEAITGISTYNVIPFEAGQYFNKIQCFCFEEQRLNPNEEVDMPVFFYIDPEFVDDPYLMKVNEITLSYTFFEAKDVSWPDLQK
eukprot:gene9214-10188_t